MLSDEMIVALTIYNYCDPENNSGISFSQIVQILSDVLPPERISISFDILLEAGIISPKNAKVLQNGHYQWMRTYLPTGEYMREEIRRILTAVYNFPQPPGSKPKYVRINVVERANVVAFNQDRNLFSFAILKMQEYLPSGTRVLDKTLAYKLVANFILDWVQINRFYQPYTEWQPAPFGAIPVFRKGVLNRDYNLEEMEGWGNWRMENGQIHSTLKGNTGWTSLLSEGASEQDLVQIDHLVRIYAVLAGEPPTATNLNILATCRDPEKALKCASFEYKQMWCRLFPALMKVYQEIYLLPSWGDSRARISKLKGLCGAVYQWPLQYPDVKERCRTAAKRLRDICGSSGGMMASNKVEVENSLKELLDGVRACAQCAAEQTSKKLSDYLHELPTLRSELLKLHQQQHYFARTVADSIKDEQNLENDDYQRKLVNIIKNLTQPVDALCTFIRLAKESFDISLWGTGSKQDLKDLLALLDGAKYLLAASVNVDQYYSAVVQPNHQRVYDYLLKIERAIGSKIRSILRRA